MSILNIIRYPDPFLKTHAAPVKDAAEVSGLIADMIETMYAANGIGLAAVQVGVAVRVIVLDAPDEEPDDDGDGDRPRRRVKGKNLVALINPEIVSAIGTVVFEEGCLSLPGETANVERAAQVRIKALDREGKPVEFDATGLFAIALQHEIDHLDGIVFIDRISRLKREFIKRRLRKAAEAAMERVL